MRYTPRQTTTGTTGNARASTGKRSKGRTSKAVVAAGSTVLLLASLGNTSFAAGPTRPADLPACGTVGGVLDAAGQLCTTVVDAVLPDATLPDLPALPTDGVLPDLSSILPSVPGGDPTGAVPGLPDLSSLLPAAALADLPTPGDLPLPSGAVPTVPGLDAAPGAIGTVFDNVDPIIGTLHDSVPVDAVPTDALPIDAVTGALGPVIAPVRGAVGNVGNTITGAVPEAGPIVGPVLTTVNGLPGQVAGVVTGAVNGAGAVPLGAAGGSSASTTGAVPGAGDETERLPLNTPSANTPAGFAANRAAAAAAAGGDSLPVTGIGFAGVGLAGAIALGWGSFARALASRKRLARPS